MPVLCEIRLFSVSAYYHEATLSVFSPYTSPGLSPVKSFHSVPLLLAPFPCLENSFQKQS